MPNPKRRHSKTRTAKRRTHDALKPVGLERVPALPRGQAAAPRLRELRVLPRPPGASGRRRITAVRSRCRVPGATCSARCTLEHDLAPEHSAPDEHPAPDMIWIAVDAMGGDDAPGHVVDGALAASRHFDLGVTLVGPEQRLEAELSAASRRRSRARPHRRRGRGHRRWRSRRRRRCAASRRASIKVAAETVARGEAAALFSAGHTGATVMAAYGAFGMLPGVDRPALAATIPTRGSPAVLLDVGASVECRPQHLLQFAVMGSVYARVGVRHRRAARRPAVDRRGRDQGQRADARGAPAAQGVAADLHRQRRGARRLQRRRRRHRLRRVHRQRRAEGQRRARRGGRGAAARGAVEHVHHARRLAADAPGAAALPQARRLLRVRRRAAARRRRHRHRRPRPVEREGRAQRRRDGVSLRRRASSSSGSSARSRPRRRPSRAVAECRIDRRP